MEITPYQAKYTLLEDDNVSKEKTVPIWQGYEESRPLNPDGIQQPLGIDKKLQKARHESDLPFGTTNSAGTTR